MPDNEGVERKIRTIEERKAIVEKYWAMKDKNPKLSIRMYTNFRDTPTPSKDLKTACNYYIERYDTVIRFLDYPFATSSNQLAEQQIRPFVVGRKAFLFCITELGAEVSAAYYSLVQTCVRMGVDVEDYLTHVFFNGGRLKDGDVESWSGLLPGKADLTEAHNYRMMLKDAKPDVNRSEPYVLRGRKPVLVQIIVIFSHAALILSEGSLIFYPLSKVRLHKELVDA